MPLKCATDYAVSGDVLVVQCQSEFTGWDLLTGALLWSYSLPDNSEKPLMVTSDTLVGVSWSTVTPVSGLTPGSASSSMVALDAATGGELWRRQLDGPEGETRPPLLTVLAGPASRALIVASSDDPFAPQRVESVDASGTAIWTTQCTPYDDGGIEACVVVMGLLDAGALAFVSDSGGALRYVVDVNSGQVLPTLVPPEVSLGGENTTSSAKALFANGSVFSARTGERWFDLSERLVYDTGGGIAVPRIDGSVDFLNYDGTVRWSIPASVIDQFGGRPSIYEVNGRLIVKNVEGELILIDQASGQPAETQAIAYISGAPMDRYFTRWATQVEWLDQGADLHAVPIPPPG